MTVMTLTVDPKKDIYVKAQELAKPISRELHRTINEGRGELKGDRLYSSATIHCEQLGLSSKSEINSFKNFLRTMIDKMEPLFRWELDRIQIIGDQLDIQAHRRV